MRTAAIKAKKATTGTKGTKEATSLIAFFPFSALVPVFILVAVFAFVASFTGCFGIGKKGGKFNVFDLSDQRVSDLNIIQRVIGKKEFLFFSTTKTGVFLEGYIQGTITDYYDNPIEGVVVRALPAGSTTGEGEEDESGNVRTFESSSFDLGISDSNGLYRVRFSLPLIDKRVDMRGRLVFNPGWEQQRTNLGRAYEPQTRETNFRLYYDARTGLLAFGEGIRKTIVQPVGAAKSKTLPGAAAPPAAPAKTDTEKTSVEAEDDIFKGFGFE